MIAKRETCALDGAGTSRAQIIAGLNDRFRATLTGGRLVVTSGVVALGPDALTTIVQQVRSFATFDADNDPYDEHDFGSLQSEGTTIFWKIDYYDLSPKEGSPDPADSVVTTRVLTIMRSDEY